MPPAADLETRAGIDLGPDPAPIAGAFGMRCGEIERRERGGGSGNLLPPRHDLADQILEQPQF